MFMHIVNYVLIWGANLTKIITSVAISDYTSLQHHSCDVTISSNVSHIINESAHAIYVSNISFYLICTQRFRQLVDQKLAQ